MFVLSSVAEREWRCVIEHRESDTSKPIYTYILCWLVRHIMNDRLFDARVIDVFVRLADERLNYLASTHQSRPR